MVLGVKIKTKVDSFPHMRMCDRISNAIHEKPKPTMVNNVNELGTCSPVQKTVRIIDRGVDEGTKSEMKGEITKCALDMTAHVGLSDEGKRKFLLRAKRKAEKMIGKYGESEGPVQNVKSKRKRSWLVKMLTKIMAAKTVKMKQHKCRFEDTPEAAYFNAKWLKYYKWDLTEALSKQSGTIIDPGSEFRSQEILQELWCKDENWLKMRDIISTGLRYPLMEISEKDRKSDLEHMMERGNHRLAQTPIENADK